LIDGLIDSLIHWSVAVVVVIAATIKEIEDFAIGWEDVMAHAEALKAKSNMHPFLTPEISKALLKIWSHKAVSRAFADRNRQQLDVMDSIPL
jgi:hypothetical protein